MPNLLAQILLFVSSYSPLLLIFAGQLAFNQLLASLVLLAVALSGLVGLWVLLKQAYKNTKRYEVAQKASPLDGDVVGYLVVYLLPFLGVDLTKPESVLPFVIFLVLIGILYVNSHMVYINPILTLRGYHIYRVVTESGEAKAVISKRDYIPSGTELGLRRVTNYVYVE